jgi:hypothetical protein
VDGGSSRKQRDGEEDIYDARFRAPRLHFAVICDGWRKRGWQDVTGGKGKGDGSDGKGDGSGSVEAGGIARRRWLAVVGGQWQRQWLWVA